MPYVNIKITPEDATAEKKSELIKGVTELLSSVLKKNPATTFVVIDLVATEDWGIGGVPVDTFRLQQKEHRQ
ncbi:MAG: 4-oxalocrotonate tautomerase family protein [Stappiaceae bacterium]